MKKGDVKTKRGFTIIEVSLVLAIAGLIFLMVFVALPSLQRGQRDAQRREAVMTYLEQLKKYQSNNRGALPNSITEWNAFLNNYLKNKNFFDPSGGDYRQDVVTCDQTTSNGVQVDAACNNSKINEVYSSYFPYNNYTMLVVTQASCNGDRPIKTSNPRNVAVLYRLEGAGVYCGNT